MQSVKNRERTGALGALGECLAGEALINNGFENIKNLNTTQHNHPFGDLLAERDGKKYLISVKARNEKKDDGRLNDSYNCIIVSKAKNDRLKDEGKSVEEITKLAIKEVKDLALLYEAVPAWITIPIRPERGAYAVYFGLLSQLGEKRAIPMTPDAIRQYQCLVQWKIDNRITAALSNKKKSER